MKILWQDLRFGARMLRKEPGFTLIAVFTLALGIGANTAIFSIVDAMLLRPLPYPDPDRLVMLWERNPGRGIEQESVSPPDFDDWRTGQRIFDEMGYWSGAGEFNLVGPDGVEKVRAVYASSDLLPALGVNPLLGRGFLPEEDQREGNRAALVGYEFWQRRFAGDAGAIGRTLTMDTFGRRNYTILGVLPPGFQFPEQSEIWLAAGWNGLPRDRRNGPWLNVLARLRHGVSVAAAQAGMDAVQARIAGQYPQSAIGTRVAIVPLLEQTLGARVRPALLTLWGIVACVLLIACANVANLSLARAAGRQKEIAVRLALGATRLRVARQLLTESLLLALCGGALGAGLAYGALRLIVIFNAGHIPRLQEATVDGGVILFTSLVSLATGALFGLAPAWQSSRPDLNEALKDGNKGATAGSGGNRLRGLLVAAEVALSLLLLIGAGLMTRSFVLLTRIDRGFETDRLLRADLDFSVSGFTTWIQSTATRPQVTLRAIMERLRNLPGVRSVGAVSGFPRGTYARGQMVAFENNPAAGEARHAVNFQGATPDYFRAMVARLMRGRTFTEADTLEAPTVAVINEAMARRFFPSQDAIGKRIAMEGQNPGQLVNPNPFAISPWIGIVGVVSDIRRLNFEATNLPEAFLSYWQSRVDPVMALRHE
jgi:putative ABC transport system permease protein